MATLLVIDDTPEILTWFRALFQRTAHHVVTAANGDDGMRAFIEFHPDIVFLDVSLPDISGIDLLQRLRERDWRIPIIIMTGHGNPDLVIDAMQQGACDYISKPLRCDALTTLVDRVSKFEQAGAAPAVEAPLPEGDFVGRSPCMEDVYKSIGRVAASDACVMILGETGSGKELAARTIWRRSRRADLPFVAVNCAALTSSLLESELFGHEQGAFTGADKRRAGVFEQCHNGTLFLDEIGDLQLATQAKILRVLQEHEFVRVGGEQNIPTNARIITATNRNLQELVERGEFRKDLYYRINTFAIHLPPLRDRAGDVPLLAGHFLRQANLNHHKTIQGFTHDAMELLERFPWPGNVRELQAAITHAVLQTSGAVITPAALPDDVRAAVERSNEPKTAVAPNLTAFIRDRLRCEPHHLYDDAVSLVEQQVLREVMLFTGENQSQAAKILGLSRPTLRKKLRACGLI